MYELILSKTYFTNNIKNKDFKISIEYVTKNKKMIKQKYGYSDLPKTIKNIVKINKSKYGKNKNWTTINLNNKLIKTNTDKDTDKDTHTNTDKDTHTNTHTNTNTHINTHTNINNDLCIDFNNKNINNKNINDALVKFKNIEKEIISLKIDLNKNNKYIKYLLLENESYLNYKINNLIAQYRENNTFKKYDINSINLNNIKNLYNGSLWNNYRLGDYIRGKGKINKDEFSGTIGNIYKNITNSSHNFKLLYNIFKNINYFEKPLDNVIVVHLRIGDVLEEYTDLRGYWSPLKCEQIFDLVKKLNKSKIKNIHFLFGSHKKLNSYEKSIKYLKDVKNKFIDYNIKFIFSKNPDFDFYYMCHSKYFIKSGGGYSEIISKYITTIGNTVLNNNVFCCETLRKKNNDHILNKSVNKKDYLKNINEKTEQLKLYIDLINKY